MGEAKREGLDAIPSGKFENNYAYFQIVMLAYNIWRSFKMLAEHNLKEEKKVNSSEIECALNGVMDNTIRIARLKLLFIAAKIPVHSNTNKVKYSEHDSRVSGFFGFLKYLDKLRGEISPWLDNKRWRSRHMSVFGIQQTVLTG